jgi:signal peptidase I
LPSLSLKKDLKKITSWVLLLLLVIGIIIQTVLIYTKFVVPVLAIKTGSFLPHYVSPNKTQLELRKHLREGDVVLSDRYTSWSIPVYTGAKVIALFHTPPHVDDNLERINDVETFYNVVTTYEERKGILKKYGVTHIFLNFRTAGREIEPILKKMGLPIIARDKSFCLFSVPTNNTK